MKIQRMSLLFPIAILLLSVDFIHAECPRYQVPHTVGSMTVCCKPVFNCAKDHEVLFCNVDGGNDKCIPCDDGFINSYVTSSIDVKQHVCFKKLSAHEDCPLEDTFATAENESCKEMYCRCKTEECRYGNVCEICTQRRTECGVNEEINAVTGECEPCGALMSSPAGCGPCLYNETAWRLTQEGLATDTGTSVHKVTTRVTKPVVTKVDPSPVSDQDDHQKGETGYSIETDGEYNTSDSSTEQAKGNDDDDFSMIPVIIIIAILVFIGIVVAVILYIKKKIKDGDSNSRLVVLYRRLVPNKYAQSASQQDEEAVPQNGNVPHDTETRQTQAVHPMVRQTEAGATGGDDGANLALLKDPTEETRQKEI